MKWKTLGNGSRHSLDDIRVEVRSLHAYFVSDRLSLGSYLEAISELRQKTHRCDIQPYHTWGMWSASVGLIFLLCWNSAEFIFLDLIDFAGNWLEILYWLGLAAFAIAVRNFHIYFLRENIIANIFNELPNEINQNDERKIGNS